MRRSGRALGPGDRQRSGAGMNTSERCSTLKGVSNKLLRASLSKCSYSNQKKKMTLSSQEFLRRFLLHVLPRGFVRIRFFGFLANRCRRTLLPQCRLLLNQPQVVVVSKVSPVQPTRFRCPRCAGPMIILESFPSCDGSPFIFRSSTFDSS